MKSVIVSIGLVLAVLLVGCNASDTDQANARRTGTPVTAFTVKQQRVEVMERSVARLHAPKSPAVAAETQGRVTAVLVDAGSVVEVGDTLARLDGEAQRYNLQAAQGNVERLEALLENQQKTVARIADLVRRELAATSTLDDATSQRAALKAQLDEARAKRDEAARNQEQTQIRSPVTGMVQSRMISEGDFVAVGQPIFDIVAAERLQAIAPFPETVSGALQIGQKAYIAPVRLPEESIEAAISEVRPQIGLRSRAVDVIIELDNPGGWRPGGSVTVAVVVDSREQSLTVPPESIVRRPSGIVVYSITDSTAHQREVVLGVQTSDWVEILHGLEPGDTVVRKGAGFLIDGVTVDVQQADQ